jgi:hypothetical protein
MGLLKFIGAVFLIIFGFIFLISTIPTLVVGGLLTGNLTGAIIITLIEVFVGITMFASGFYICVIELNYTKIHIENEKIHIETEQVATSKNEPVSMKSEINVEEQKPKESDYLFLLFGLILGSLMFLFLFTHL